MENGKLIIGEQSYSKVICEHCDMLFENTEKLLKEFTQSGGEIVTADILESVDVINNERITYTKRTFDGFNVYYFVNTSANYEKAEFNVNGKMLDIYSGDLLEFNGSHEFEPWGSLMLIEDGSENINQTKAEPEYIRPSGDFEVINSTPNSLLLDCCDYYFGWFHDIWCAPRPAAGAGGSAGGSCGPGRRRDRGRYLHTACDKAGHAADRGAYRKESGRGHGGECASARITG